MNYWIGNMHFITYYPELSSRLSNEEIGIHPFTNYPFQSNKSTFVNQGICLASKISENGLKIQYYHRMYDIYRMTSKIQTMAWSHWRNRTWEWHSTCLTIMPRKMFITWIRVTEFMIRTLRKFDSCHDRELLKQRLPLPFGNEYNEIG